MNDKKSLYYKNLLLLLFKLGDKIENIKNDIQKLWFCFDKIEYNSNSRQLTVDSR